MYEIVKLIPFIIFGVAFICITIGWRMEKKFDELIEVTRRKKASSAWHYIENARSQIQYNEYAMANYWLLLALIALIAEEDI